MWVGVDLQIYNPLDMPLTAGSMGGGTDPKEIDRKRQDLPPHLSYVVPLSHAVLKVAQVDIPNRLAKGWSGW
jgi:hypothetical protein